MIMREKMGLGFPLLIGYLVSDHSPLIKIKLESALCCSLSSLPGIGFHKRHLLCSSTLVSSEHLEEKVQLGHCRTSAERRWKIQ